MKVVSLIKCCGLFCCLFWASQASAANIYVSDYGSHDGVTAADVQDAIDAASPGDTVILSAGSASWPDDENGGTAGVLISKGITLQGAGRGLTIISDDGSFAEDDELINITLSADAPLRITGITFSMSAFSARAIEVTGKYDSSFALTELRIDSCGFSKGKRTVRVGGWVYGCIDNNIFTNCYIDIGIWGDGTESWGRPIVAGTANALFIEDNVFRRNNDAGQQLSVSVYHENGARVVTRYNLFDSSTYDVGGAEAIWFDSHGNQNYYSVDDGYRGQPLIEVYHNTCKGLEVNAGAFQIRGGYVLMWANDFQTDNGSRLIPYLYEEESGDGTTFDGYAAGGNLRSEWPAEDQIVLFAWSNTCDWEGDTCTAGVLDAVSKGAASGAFLTENKDYFFHAPQAGQGKAAYTARVGASGSHPTDDDPFADTGTFAWSGSADNEFYPYTPYTYPHPLRDENYTAQGMSFY